MIDSIGSRIASASQDIFARVGNQTARLTDDPGGRASDARDGARTTGRDSIRPGRGDGPALPTDSTVTPGSAQPGFPNPPPAPATGDGSGAHGSEAAGIGDHLNEAGFYRVADAADAMGLDNAARHMRHYLGNTGETLQIDPAQLASDIPAIGAEMDTAFETNVRAQAEAYVEANYTGEPMQFTIETPWTSTYATKALSQDWFYAVGGFSYAHTATVTVTPGENGAANVSIESEIHVFDRYNWDAGKGVNIGPIRIGDEQLGRMHEAGLAQEYEVRGTADGPSTNFTVDP